MSTNAPSARGFDAHAVAQTLFSLAPVEEPAKPAPLTAPVPEQATAPAAITVPRLQVTEDSTVLLPDNLSDFGNAKLFARLHRDTFRYAEGIGWLTWSDYRWDRRNGEKAATWAAAEMGHAYPVKDPSGRFKDAELRKHRKSSESAAGIRSMLHIAAASPELRLEAEELDADAYVLCTPGGIVDLRTGAIRPADPLRDFNSRATHVAPMAMETPRWFTFLGDCFGVEPEDQAMIEYIKELLGYAITGDTGAQILPFLYGKGSNGKSVLVNVLRMILGDYADAAPPGFLMERKFTEHSTELTELQGRRIIICSELNREDYFDEARVKMLTGQDNIKARRMRQDYGMSWRPTHHLILVGNHQPTVKTGGPAFWRRIRLVPLLRVIPDDRKIDNLDRILVSEEGPGILNWLIEGSVKYLKNRGTLKGPERVQQATDGYEEAENFIGRFLKDCCDIGTSYRTEQGLLYSAFCLWAEEEEAQIPNSREFATRVRAELGIPGASAMVRSDGLRHYPGVRLKGAIESRAQARLAAQKARK